MTLTDIVATSCVLGAGWFVLSAAMRSYGALEGRVIAASFALHALGSVATAIVSNIVYHGLVDFIGFDRAGSMIADAIRQDPWQVLPRAVALFFHQDTIINVPLNFEAKGGRSTVSMWIIAAFGNLLFFGSFQATATACALFSFSGKLAAYRVLRAYIAAPIRPYACAAALLVPSVVYWTSGLIKEGIAVGGLGMALYGAHRFLFERRRAAIAIAVAGVLIVAMVKPYLLMPFGVGFGCLVYIRAATRGGTLPFRIRPMYLLAGGAIGVAAIVGVGRFFPLFAVENLGEAASKMQFYGQKAAGGSFYLLGDPSEASFLGQLRYAPIALFTSLYRPTIFDVANPLLLLNAFETTFLLGLTVYVWFTQGWRRIVATILTNPALAFAVGFALPLAVGVGLVSNNLGTLSRYRCPLVPYQVLVLAVVYASGLPVFTRPVALADRPSRLGLLPPNARPRPPARPRPAQPPAPPPALDGSA